MKKRTRKVLAIVLATIMIFAIPMSSSAYEIDTVAPATAEEPSIQPRTFQKTIQKPLPFMAVQILKDDNWWGEPNVTVTFKKGYAGQRYIKVYVVDKYGQYSQTRTLYENEGYKFSIPAGKFEVWAMAGDKAGTADIGVALSW